MKDTPEEIVGDLIDALGPDLWTAACTKAENESPGRIQALIDAAREEGRKEGLGRAREIVEGLEAEWEKDDGGVAVFALAAGRRIKACE